jgi:F0F1-type ATP synthase assembly protein I
VVTRWRTRKAALRAAEIVSPAMAEDSPARRDARPRSDEPDRRPSGSDIGWGITGTLLSGIIVWGGVGLALDRWWGTRFVVLIGVILGLTVAIYLVVVKYGAVDPPPKGRRPPGTTRGGRRRPGQHGQTQKGQR